MNRWNGKRFSIYDKEEKQVLGLLNNLGEQTNFNTDEIERLTISDNKKVSHEEMKSKYKIDENADFTGSWYGIKKPTQSNEGIASTVEQIIDETIPNINTQLEQIATTGTTIEVVQNKVEEMAEQGLIQAYTLGDGTVEPKKTTFLKQSINIFNKNTIENGYTYNTNGVKVSNATYFVSEFIPFDKTLYINTSDTLNVVVFDSSKKYLRRNGWGASSIPFASGDGFIVVTELITKKDNIILTDNENLDLSIKLTDDFLDSLYLSIKNKENNEEIIVKKPVVAFIDDDGKTDFLTKVKPIFDKYGIKCGIGAITDRIGTEGYMSAEQLLALQTEGFEIMSHSTSHSTGLYNVSNELYNNTYDQYLTDMYNSLRTLRKNGLKVNKFVYPYGWYEENKYADIMIKNSRQYYDYSFSVYDGDVNSSNVNKNLINRTFIRDAKLLSYYEWLFNKVIKEKGMLIIGTHSGLEELTQEFLESVISLLKTKNIDIMTVEEGVNYKKNIEKVII